MKGVPSVGTKVLVEATVVHLNAGEWAWSADAEGPLLPIPCVQVREGISFGVAAKNLRAAPQQPSTPSEKP